MFKNHIKILDKYIIKEITFPFLASVIIITIILLGNFLFQLTDLIIVKEVPIPLVLELLLYNLPDIIVRTFPIAILFSTMTEIGRLNRENEITAFRMGGISLYRLIIPVLILGLLISGLTYVFNEEVVPWSNHKARNIIRNTILKESMPNTQEEVFFRGPKGRLFYVKEYNEEDETLNNIIIYNMKSNNQDETFPEVITANKGTIKENVWILENGIIHEYNDEGNIILESQFDKMEFQITEEMREVYGNQKTTDEMSREELAKNIKLFKQSGITVNSLLVDYHLKLAQPLVAFIFVLIAVPLSLTNKESKVVNITFTIIIIFAYYLLLSVCRSLGRNEILPPLLAAWLPNITFLILGLLILFWKESFEKLLYKILPGTLVFLLVFSIMPLNTIHAAEELTLNSNSVIYDPIQNMIKIEGKVSGKYENIYLKSDLINVKVKSEGDEIFKQPEYMELLPGDITGCDFEEPHYYFDAKRIEISPKEHLKAYHVVFRELGGNLPLFYWPYLYISLKDDEQNFFPRVGYNSRRGWFLKTTYTYYLDNFDLPGSLYVDYYTLSGFAGGVKQYLINTNTQKGYIYYYKQDNNINLDNLFNWEGEIYHQFEDENWQEESSFFYQEYDDKEEFESDLSFNNRLDNRNINIDTYYDSINYYKTTFNDTKSYGADLSFSNKYFDTLSVDIGYDVDYDYDPEDGLDEYIGKEIDLVNEWGNNWEIGLEYEHEEQNEPDEEKEIRWGGKAYLSKAYKKYKHTMLWERYDPNFSVEDEVAFYKAPEFITEYKPPENYEYLFKVGRYYEAESGIEGNRIRVELLYDERFNIGSYNTLNVDQKFHFNHYRVEYMGEIVKPYQAVSESEINLTTELGANITLDNNYKMTRYNGFSPFNFDQAEFETIIENKLNYRIKDRVDIEINGGYDFKNKEFLLLEMLSNFKITENWDLQLGTTYDMNRSEFDDNLFITSRYDNDRTRHKLGLEYDLNTKELIEADSNFSYEIKGDWGWYLENNLSFDFMDEGETIEEANIQLKKKFHCREIIFSYNYLKDEYTLQYSINLFPSQGIEFIKNEDALIFDSDIKDMLQQEN
jgi:LPS export ABC transporter permease LptF